VNTELSLLDRARRQTGMSHAELWSRYFELGGMSTALELEAYLYDALSPPATTGTWSPPANESGPNTTPLDDLEGSRSDGKPVTSVRTDSLRTSDGCRCAWSWSEDWRCSPGDPIEVARVGHGVVAAQL